MYRFKLYLLSPLYAHNMIAIVILCRISKCGYMQAMSSCPSWLESDNGRKVLQFACI